jgi:enoyl-CoA hydratase
VTSEALLQRQSHTIAGDVGKRVITLTLNRANKKNAMTRAMWVALKVAIDEAQDGAKAPGSRVLVLRAQGNSFCAGADIAELMANVNDADWLTSNHADVQAALSALYQCPLPTIAVINGDCVGGGLGLAAACDFRLASHSARFALTPAKLGLSYSVADTRRITALVGVARARELLFTGAPWSAAQALTFGLLHQLHAPNTLENAIDTLVAGLAACSGNAISAIKTTLLALENGQHAEDVASQERFNAAFSSPDFLQGARAFLEKRVP